MFFFFVLFCLGHLNKLSIVHTFPKIQTDNKRERERDRDVITGWLFMAKAT